MNFIPQIIINKDEIQDLILSAIGQKRKLLITYFNQNCFNHFYTNPVYRELLRSHFITYLDGIGIYSVFKILTASIPDRFNASDLYNTIINYLIANNIGIFLVGGNFDPEFVKYTAQKNNLKLLGYVNGFNSCTDLSDLIYKIKSVSADIIIIGMGVPKQEILAEYISKNIHNTLILCVGNFMEFYFGTVKRVPAILRDKGVEWIYRLIVEPRRLWKRYLVGIPLFIYRIIKLKLEKRL